MPYYINCSNKILTLEIALFFFTFSGVYEFAMVPGMYILLPLRKNRYTVLPEGTDVYMQQHTHQKDLNTSC